MTVFSEKTLEFLFENRLHDSKEWYHEHKDLQKKYVTEPFTELIAKLEPTMAIIDLRIDCNPKRISRIYRDVRFTKDKSTYRDNMWCTFGAPKAESHELPSFYFGVSPRGYDYGLGYYSADRYTMEAVREMILENNKSFREAKKAYNSQNKFVFGGELYKRNRFPEQPPENCEWLNRKNIFFFYSNSDVKPLFQENLYKEVAADYLTLAPVYKFLVNAEERALLKREKPEQKQ